MRVVVCMFDFYGGGAERVAVLLANAMAEQGAEVVLFCSTREGPNFKMVSDKVILNVAEGKGLSYIKQLVHLIKSWKPNLIHVHQTPRIILTMIAHLLAFNYKSRKIACFEHGEMHKTMKRVRGIQIPIFNILIRVLYPLADYIVCVSENVKTSVDKFVLPFRSNTIVMDNAVIFKQMLVLAEETPTHPWLLDKSLPTVITLGRLAEQKNHSLLLRAFKIVSERIPARLIIFGEGPLRPELEKLVEELSLGGVAQLPGYTDNPFAALRHASLFALSSEWEGLPTVAIEALTCGTPVVSTDNSTGIHAILAEPDTGRIVANDDPVALAEAIILQLQTEVDRTTLPRYVQRYHVDFIAKQHLQLAG